MPVQRVLLVEDDPVSALALATILRRRGFEVIHATSVLQGLDFLAQKPAVVVLDLMLPDGDGAAILKQIRDRNLSVRVLITTAVSDPHRIKELQLLKPEVIMQKPIDLPSLLALLRPPQ